jgi:hypothetical protein
MHTHLLADTGHLIGVLLILAGAVGYLTIYYRRTIKGETGSACGTNCGIPLKRTKTPPAQSPEAKPPGSGQQFVPAEDLADRAARRRQEQEKKVSG